MSKIAKSEAPATVPLADLSNRELADHIAAEETRQRDLYARAAEAEGEVASITRAITQAEIANETAGRQHGHAVLAHALGEIDSGALSVAARALDAAQLAYRVALAQAGEVAGFKGIAESARERAKAATEVLQPLFDEQRQRIISVLTARATERMDALLAMIDAARLIHAEAGAATEALSRAGVTLDLAEGRPRGNVHDALMPSESELAAARTALQATVAAKISGADDAPVSVQRAA
jgi:hypothetical protein